MPEMQVNGSMLHGPDVRIAVSTLLDGGTWLRPLRGDMVRVPVPDTQVKILITGADSDSFFAFLIRKYCSMRFSIVQ